MSESGVTPKPLILIPARRGSTRIPGKNIRRLAGHPLIAYAIATANHSKIAASVVVSTDSEEIANVAAEYGAEVPFLRPSDFATSISPDIEWVSYTLNKLQDLGRSYDCFSILRPTSPFRQVTTVRRAWKQFLETSAIDSLRAVEKCKQHPGKMWVVRDARMAPLLPFALGNVPWHSCQYQSLPEIYVQNASLEIAWTRVVFETHTISGSTIAPFFTEGVEGFDLNYEEDWALAERLIADGIAALPDIL